MAVMSTLRNSTYDYEWSSETEDQEIIERNDRLVEDDIVEEDIVEDEVTIYEHDNKNIFEEIGDDLTEVKDDIEEDIFGNGNDQIEVIQEEESIYENEDVTKEVDEIQIGGGSGEVWRNW